MESNGTGARSSMTCWTPGSRSSVPPALLSPAMAMAENDRDNRVQREGGGEHVGVVLLLSNDENGYAERLEDAEDADQSEGGGEDAHVVGGEQAGEDDRAAELQDKISALGRHHPQQRAANRHHNPPRAQPAAAFAIAQVGARGAKISRSWQEGWGWARLLDLVGARETFEGMKAADFVHLRVHSAYSLSEGGDQAGENRRAGAGGWAAGGGDRR